MTRQTKLDPDCICFEEFFFLVAIYVVLTYNLKLIHQNYETQLMYKSY
jgi:hypothetical protein